MIFVCLLFLQDSPLSIWSKEQTIRVGLNPVLERPQFDTHGGFLIMDGDQVVQKLTLNEPFWVVRNQGQTSRGYWVQLQASKSKTVLENTQKVIETKAPPNTSFQIGKSGRLFVLLAGPFEQTKEARQFQKQAKSWGIPDAFIVQKTTEWPFAIVDQNFDKFPIRAIQPAFVKSDPMQPIAYGDKNYRGILRLKTTENRIRVINILPLEIYLRGVVPAELGPHVFPEIEALKAQAVAARTYAIKNLNGFSARGYDICDGPACQAYGGFDNEHPMSDEAVLETKGLVLSYQGELIDALYTSTCANSTEDVGNVFPGRTEPYLRAAKNALANFESTTLPIEGPNLQVSSNIEHALIRLWLQSHMSLPDIKEPITGEKIKPWLAKHPAFHAEMVEALPDGAISHRAFWQAVAKHPLVRGSENHLFSENDRLRASQWGEVSAQEAFFIHAGLKTFKQIQEMRNEDNMTTQELFHAIVDWGENFSPDLKWKRGQWLGETESHWIVRTGFEKTTEIEKEKIRYLVTQSEGGSWSFLSHPQIQELDFIYWLEDRPDLLRLQLNGTQAVVDRVSRHSVWMTKSPVDELEEQARKYIPQIKGVRDVKISKRSETGRVTELKWIADSGTHTVNGLRIRWSLGIKDNLFDMTPVYRDGRLSSVTFMGRGWGHGVGMCQVGAYAMARQGSTFDEILTHYYTGVEITNK